MNDDFIATLYDQYAGELLKYCEWLMRYDPKYTGQAEDIVHDVFIVALRKQDQLLRHPNPYGWLAKTCWNKCYTLLRKDQRRRGAVGETMEFIDSLSVASQKDLIIELLFRMDAEAFVNLLQEKLTPMERAVFPLYFIDRQSARSTAEALDSRVEAINDAVRRIRRKALRLNWLTLFCLLAPLSFLRAI